MRTRHICKVYPAMPFDIAESKLSRELQAYYEAIHSYPDCFAKTGLSFEQHLLNVIAANEGSRTGGTEYLEPAV